MRVRPRVSTSGTAGTGFGTAPERERAAGGLGRRGDADHDLLALPEVGLEQRRQRPVALARLDLVRPHLALVVDRPDRVAGGPASSGLRLNGTPRKRTWSAAEVDHDDRDDGHG